MFEKCFPKTDLSKFEKWTLLIPCHVITLFSSCSAAKLLSLCYPSFWDRNMSKWSLEIRNIRKITKMYQLNFYVKNVDFWLENSKLKIASLAQWCWNWYFLTFYSDLQTLLKQNIGHNCLAKHTNPLLVLMSSFFLHKNLKLSAQS